MAHGKLQCIGDSIHLKTKYGSGYNLHLTVAVEKEAAVNNQITTAVPQVKKISSNAGNVIYGIAQDYLQPLIELLKQIERDTDENNSSSAIKEWSISNATLEDVYLKVTASSDFSFAKVQHKGYGTV